MGFNELADDIIVDSIIQCEFNYTGHDIIEIIYDVSTITEVEQGINRISLIHT